MNTMNYKGYAARIEFSAEDACFVGRVAGIRDVIGFHGESVAELQTAFEEAVDDYLATCQRLQRDPQRAHSGRLMLRIDPSIHASAAMQAEAQGKSLNAWAQDAIRQALGQSG